MADEEVLREVEGPDGVVEVARRAKLLGKWFYCVTHKDSGKYALFDGFEEAMRKAYELAGRRPSIYDRALDRNTAPKT